MNLPQKYFLLGAFLCANIFVTISQELPSNWHLLDYKKDNIPGISLDQAKKLISSSSLKPQPVIVAVLDSGVDINHDALSPFIWTNTKEKAGNNKDDDQNGYVDDTHGWNFIGNAKGESLVSETLELTRLYRAYKARFENKDKFSISPEEKQDYLEYLRLKQEYDSAKEELSEQLAKITEEYSFFNELIPPLQKAMKSELFTEFELSRFEPKGQLEERLKTTFLRILSGNQGLSAEKLIEHYLDTKNNKEMFETRLGHNYNLNYDGRKLIGDDVSNVLEKYYGNADVTKRAEHGTHVSGIINAKSDKKSGMRGIADHAIIMPIRSTPMGDEMDKDVANGIRYAVDNGAKIINMSFGKAYSPNKKIVDEAIKYAESKGVLLIHGAGNDHKNIDLYYSYPSPLLEDGTVATNWIEVGATSAYMDEGLAARFSNYGKKSVDLFAPGVDIYSTLPDQKFGVRSGTSMAAPVVTGVAALLLTYFPELTPQEVKSILIESGVAHDQEVKLPGVEERVPFSSLSITGKIVNAHKAIELALKKQKEN